jgi:hypothetical protein
MNLLASVGSFVCICIFYVLVWQESRNAVVIESSEPWADSAQVANYLLGSGNRASLVTEHAEGKKVVIRYGRSGSATNIILARRWFVTNFVPLQVHSTNPPNPPNPPAENGGHRPPLQTRNAPSPKPADQRPGTNSNSSQTLENKAAQAGN